MLDWDMTADIVVFYDRWKDILGFKSDEIENKFEEF
jgi:hypothetical protein